MASFSSTIEATFLTSIYATRQTNAQDAAGNPSSAVTTICSNVLGDVQPARGVLYHQMAQGADYRLTHVFFGDVPAIVPTEGDAVFTSINSYAVRNARSFGDHIELEMERLGV